MQTHWEALAAVAVTEESCIAIDAIQARIKELKAEVATLKRRLSAHPLADVGTPERLRQDYTVLMDAMSVIAIGHQDICPCVACAALAAVESPC